ncbi:MAG: substrate-binding domain-containing protein, partial [Micrococcales bacterium]|nr:substrate-binding domain-containing protein [Micrococcales bacterium]
SVEAEAHGLRVLIEKRVDGILIAPASQVAYDHLALALSRGHAIVQVDRYVPDLDTDRIVVDNYDASYRAVQRVIEAGHQKIAAPRHDSGPVTGNVQVLSTMDDRHRGYRDALADAGLPVLERYTPGTGAREDVSAVMTELLRSSERPTAVFGLDDSYMLGILDAVYAAGLNLAKDLSLFGFDDTDWSTVVRPPLSVIAQPAYQLGAQAAARLLGRIQQPDAPRQTYVLPTTWIERGSIGPPANQ